MDLYQLRKFLSLLITALGVFLIIFLIYSIFLISRIAQKKERHEIEKGYAVEEITPSPSPIITISK